MMTKISPPFLRGLAVILPVAATLSLIAWAFIAIDGLLRPMFGRASGIPGLGVLALVLLAFFVGIAALWPHTKSWIERIETALHSIPVVKVVYTPIKEFSDALFGENKCFDKPVLVAVSGALDAEVIGFVTKDDLEALGMNGKVAVYFPQSYTFGGQLVILPRERVTALAADSSAVMAFIMSGGVAGFDACATSVIAASGTRASTASCASSRAYRPLNSESPTRAES